jgi:hypothetical protein
MAGVLNRSGKNAIDLSLELKQLVHHAIFDGLLRNEKSAIKKYLDDNVPKWMY